MREHGDAFDRALDAADCPADVRRRLRVIADRAFGRSEAGIAKTLVQHLEYAISLCRQRSVEPMLLTYPNNQKLYGLQSELAARSGVRLVDVAAKFRGVVRKTDWADLIAPDGHCNDAGYEIMGTFVAEDFLAMRRDG